MDRQELVKLGVLIRSSIDTLNFSQNSWISAFSPGVTRMCNRSLFGFSDGGTERHRDGWAPPRFGCCVVELLYHASIGKCGGAAWADSLTSLASASGG